MTLDHNIPTISCQEALDLIVAYLDRYASGAERTALEKHLEICRHCFDRVEFEKLMRERLRKLKVDPSSEDLTKKIESLLMTFS